MTAPVQTKSAHGASTASVTVTPDAPPASGNRLVIAAGVLSSTAVNTPAGWTLEHSVGPDGGSRLQFFSKVSDGTETSITVTHPSTATYSLMFYEWADVEPTNPLDKTTSPAAGTGTSRSAGTTGTLSQPDEIAIAACVLNGSFSAESWSNGFTPGPASTTRTVSGYKVVSTTDPVTTTLSWTTSRFALAAMITLRLAAPPPPAGVPTRLKSGAGFTSVVWKRWDSGTSSWVT